MKKSLGRDTTDVEARAAESTTLLDTSGLQPQLSRLDGGDIAARPAADDDDVVLFTGSRRETPREGGQRKRVLESVG
jgi:hypothetical protein